MKKTFMLMAWGLSMLFLSCGNGEEKQAATEAVDTTAVAVETPAEVAPAAPVNTVEISHTVKDYAAWKQIFDADSAAREASGLGLIAIGRNDNDPNAISITLNVTDVEKAKAFFADPRLKEVMEKGGVATQPVITFWDIERVNMDSKEKNWVLLTHKVKDYDVWLKTFDAEGTAGRAAFGLVDVALKRGLEDQNLVHLVFDITDMTKAKARLNDPSLKKLMMEAGVEGKPTMEFYTQAE